MHPELTHIFTPDLLAIERLPARAPLIGHDTAEGALGDAESPWVQSLDGPWNFRLVESPDRLPAGWPERSDDLARSWNPVAVPGCWTRQHVGDWPHYTNIVMPWPELDPPQPPRRNPTGLYHRTFDVPPAWLDRMVVLHLGGFESVAAVWCNGRFVGLGKDSRLPSEFDLGDAVVAGKNSIDVAVVRYSDATWIEDQDHWWHGGLHRSVHLEARAPCRIDDVATVADYEAESGLGSLHVDAHVCGDGEFTVRATLFDGDVALTIGTAAVPAPPGGSALEQLGAAYSYPGRVASIDLEPQAVEPWSAESPRRYRLLVELRDRFETTWNATALTIGFRRVEVRDRRLLVNGRPITLYGVNRHDHHPDTGKTLSVDDLRDDLVAMKANNINAVRCAHYPNDHRLLDLCDELGLYVVDEANIESHARLRSLSDDTRYLGAFVDRVKRMVLRDRNHPSVIIWSLGNEAGDGAAHDASAAWVRAVDPNRPVQYEGAIERRFSVNAEDPEAALAEPSRRERLVTDIVCPMYTSIATIVRWAQWAEETGGDDRPLVLCEYSHAMGNSNGSIAEYAQAFHDEPALGGGFIWDWRDQGLSEVDERGRRFWAYGGHFGDEPNDKNFCINGLVGPDLTPHPGLIEVAWAYRPVAVTPVRGRRVRVTNRRAFTSVADLEPTWTLLIEGEAVETGTLEIELEPGASTVLSIPITTDLPRGVPAHLHFHWRRRTDSPWAAAGHLVAWDQVELRSSPEVPPAPVDVTRTVALRGPGSVRAVDTILEWDAAGDARMVIDAIDVELSAIAPSLWRAPTDNDGVKQGWMSDVSGIRPSWVRWGLDALHLDLESIERGETVGGATVVTLRRVLAGNDDQAQSTTRFIVHTDAIEVHESLQVPDGWHDLPRIGTRFEIAPRFDRLQWFGAGPHESYPDRKSSALVGQWTGRIAEQYHAFVVPQEHGAHADTRWFTLTDRFGKGLRVTCDRPRSFSARFEHDHILTQATTVAQVDRADTIEVHVDAAVRGLGTAACGPDVLPEYVVGPGTWNWQMTLRAERP